MKARACAVLALASLFLPGVADAKRWYVKEGCRLLPNASNDGDSFHVRHNKREYIYRLYFVDAPETDDRIPERLVEQGAYFGIADPKVVIKVGKEAADFSRKFLAGEFTVMTKGADARGSSDKSRDYAFVMVGKEDLAVELVRNGLARIYGLQEDPPEGPSATLIRQRLSTAEREAKAQKRGAWAYSGGATTSRNMPRSAVPAPVPVTPVTEQELVLPRSIAYYSLIDSRYLGAIPQGSTVLVLRAESSTMLRIRFQAKPGTYFEAQCKRADLNI